ncbi:MAG TPA: peptidylprolyl isomerase [Anaerolineales bacterium]|nr:peptidylprolyl isomerase [Anaerolineales bacterium]
MKQRLAGWLLVCASGIVACGSRPPAPTLPTVTPVTSAATATPLPPSPTPTPEPLAALVNGEPITLAAYDQEIERCRTGKQNAGLDSADCPAVVLQSQIENLAVEQAARAAGIVISDSDLEAELRRIQASLGRVEAYQAWLAANLYSDDEFRTALRRDLLRSRMGAQVTTSVGEAAEQVHARGLLVADEATAQDLLAQIKAGADFAQLAAAYSLDLSSRPAGGDLGWFPRGLLTTPEVEQAAFALQPGQTSEVIHSALGYHIIQTLERDPARPLSLAAGQALRERALQAWLEGVITKAVVQKFVNP